MANSQSIFGTSAIDLKSHCIEERDRAAQRIIPAISCLERFLVC
ncbi:hypothetical protein [Halothece sp. PCC 7418]|nr:hypothetical protein [Halothece sp. PCC 7418]